MTFIVLRVLSAAVYFLFLCYMIWKVFKNVRRSVLLHCEETIYRVKFLMLATLLCGLLTIISFVLGEIRESRQWNDTTEPKFSSAFFIGVYGMWNIYIFALIILYAPSHKKSPTYETQENITSEKT